MSETNTIHQKHSPAPQKRDSQVPQEVQHSLRTDHRQKQRLLPIVDAEGRLAGVVSRGDLLEKIQLSGEATLQKPLSELAQIHVIEAYPDEPLRAVVHRMAEKGVTRMPVIEPETRKLLGLAALDDLLKARTRHLETERRRERPLQFRRESVPPAPNQAI